MAKVTAPMKPGPMQPSKYSHTGPNYQKFGEQTQNGFYYDATVDQYFVDPKQHKQDLQNQGVLPKDPGLADTLVPIAAGGAALAGGQYIGSHAGDWISNIGSKNGGLFSAGTPTATTTASQAAGAATNSGLMGAGGFGSSGIPGLESGVPLEAGQVPGAGFGTSGIPGLEGGPALSGGQVAGPWFGSGGTVFNTEGMIGPQGSIAPLNALAAIHGTYGVYQASKAQNKREGVMHGAMSGAEAGFAIYGPVGAGIGAIIGGLSGLAAHETTKHRTTRRFGDLSNDVSSKDFQAMVQQGAQESLGGTDTWDLGDDISKAPIDLMTRSYGVLKTFGPQWANISQDKRMEVVKKLVDNGLLNSKQGDYLIDDPQKAQDLFNITLHPDIAKPRANAPAMPQYVNPVPKLPGGSALSPAPNMPNGISSINMPNGVTDSGYTMTMPMPLQKTSNDPNYQQATPYVNPVPRVQGKKPSGMMYDFNKG